MELLILGNLFRYTLRTPGNLRKEGSVPTLRDAMHILNDRKTAAIPEEEVYFDGDNEPVIAATEQGFVEYTQKASKTTIETIALIAGGLDLDIAELSTLSAAMGGAVLNTVRHAALSGHPNVVQTLGELASSVWMDGVLTGLLLAELRSKDEEEVSLTDEDINKLSDNEEK